MINMKTFISTALTLTMVLVSATVFAADPEQPKPVSITSPVIGDIVCLPGTIESYDDGTLKKCTLVAGKAVPATEIVCQANRSISLYPDGALQECRINSNATIAPADITIQANSTITLHPDGTLQRGLLEKDKSIKDLGVACSRNNPIVLYPGGKIAACNPNDYTYVIGKGSCLPDSEVAYYPDGKTKSCTYTTPVYQNRACKVGDKVLYHPNGQFQECTLPEDTTVSGSVISCKADAPVSYNTKGAIIKCTLAMAADAPPGQLIPVGTVVQLNDKGKIVLPEIPAISVVESGISTAQ